MAKLFGVNVAGAEFASETLPGTINVNYLYASDPARFAYFKNEGQTLFRVPFRWERIQPTQLAALSVPDLNGLHAMVHSAASVGGRVILDLHNYGRYNGTPLTTDDAAKFADVWSRIATKFRWHRGLYGYELMNEPHDLATTETWPTLAQAAADAIRLVDQESMILVGGDSWQSARFWRDNNENLNITDARGKIIYAAHQYFDSDYTGTYSQPYDTYPTIGIERIHPFVEWLKEKGFRGIMTEYGVPATADWVVTLDYFLSFVKGVSELVGGTCWAAGPWWGEYALTLEPNSSGIRSPQTAVLRNYPSG